MNDETEQLLEKPEHSQNEGPRDLTLEREVHERMIKRQSEASRSYTTGKFRSA